MVTTTGSQAVKVVWQWRVKPGSEALFAPWLERLVAHAASAPGYQGSSVFAARDEHLLLLRFARELDLAGWQRSPAAIDLLAAGAALAAGPHRQQHRSGLETWFSLPGTTPPPRWKMALVTWLALLPQVIALAFVVPASIPFPLNAAISTAIPVVLLTWVVMPQLSRLLAPWLYEP